MFWKSSVTVWEEMYICSCWWWQRRRSRCQTNDMAFLADYKSFRLGSLTPCPWAELPLEICCWDSCNCYMTCGLGLQLTVWEFWPIGILSHVYCWSYIFVVHCGEVVYFEWHSVLKQTTMQDIFCWFKDILFDTTIHSMLYCIVPEMFSFFIFYFQNTDWVTQCNQFHQSNRIWEVWSCDVFLQRFDWSDCDFVWCQWIMWPVLTNQIIWLLNQSYRFKKQYGSSGCIFYCVVMAK